MNISNNFDRIDIFKAVALVLLLGFFIILAIVTVVDSDQQALGGIQSGNSTSEDVDTGEHDDIDQSGTESESQTEESGQDTPSEAQQPDSGEESEAVPQFPKSNVVLTYVKTEGVLVTPDGIAVYGLSVDRQVWIPIVPSNIADIVGTPAPQIGSDGGWIVVSSDGSMQYHWDSAALIWVIDVEVAEGQPDESETGTSPDAGDPGTTPGEGETGDQTDETEETETGEPPSPSEGEETSSQPGKEPNLPVPPAPDIPKTYTLNSGEFVYCISRRYNLNPNQVLALNGLSYSSFVYSGMKLRLPQTGDPFPGKRALQGHPIWYTVQKGDTIYSIACEFGDVYPYAIAYANELGESYKLTPGQELYIP